MGNDNDRIGLSGSTADGQSVRLASALSGQTGWRRTVAKTFALLTLVAIGGAVVAEVVQLLN